MLCALWFFLAHSHFPHVFCISLHCTFFHNFKFLSLYLELPQWIPLFLGRVNNIYALITIIIILIIIIINNNNIVININNIISNVWLFMCIRRYSQPKDTLSIFYNLLAIRFSCHIRFIRYPLSRYSMLTLIFLASFVKEISD